MTTLQMLGTNPSMRRTWLEHNTGHTLEAVAEAAFEPDEARSNIENLVGAAHVPLGVAGPIRVNGMHAQGDYYVPFATTEGTLVSTYQYGMRAITEAGGANAHVLADSLDITPCFILTSAAEAISFCQWLNDHLAELKDVAAETTSHGRLLEVHTHLFGRTGVRPLRVRHGRCDGDEHRQHRRRSDLPSRGRDDGAASATT